MCFTHRGFGFKIRKSIPGNCDRNVIVIEYFCLLCVGGGDVRYYDVNSGEDYKDDVSEMKLVV